MQQGYSMNEDFVNQMEVGIKQYKPLKGQKTILAQKISDIDLQKIDIPVLAMLGDRGVIYNPEKAIARAKKLISGVKIELMPNCCHAINMEQAEKVDRIMTDFLI